MGKRPEVRANQRYWFGRQLNLAREKALPVSIHSRDAAKDTLDIAKEERLAEIGGVVHCFSYTVEMAREYLNMGMYLGIGSVLTYKNAQSAEGRKWLTMRLWTESCWRRILLSDTCAEPRQAEFFTESAVCGDGHCGDQGYYDSRG